MKLSKFNRELKKEYKESFKEEPKKKLSIHIKLAPLYAFAAAVLVFVGVLVGNSIMVKNHNQIIYDHHSDAVSEISASWDVKPLNKISSRKEYESITASYTYETSLFEKIVDSLFGNAKATAVIVDEATNTSDKWITTDTTISAFDTSTKTNTQEETVDEGDIAKCDGKYIYYYSRSNDELMIYEISSRKCVESVYASATELYVYENTVVLIGDTSAMIYRFDGSSLEKVHEESYQDYIDSRLYGDTLYIVTRKGTYDSYSEEDAPYYDGYSSYACLYEIMKVSLTDYSVSRVSELSSYSMYMYMSEDYIVLESNVYYYSQYALFSVYDTDLNAIGVFKGAGYLTDRYCMDTKDDMFRFVLYNRQCGNSITVIDLTTYKRIGFLNEGIGLAGTDTIKSVSFQDDFCFVCTYEQKDPLYEIDLSDPSNPYIVSEYKAPGYSGYLYYFTVEDKEYVLGLGYTDENDYKISVYERTEEGTSQIGNDFVIADYYGTNADLVVYQLSWELFSNPKALFLYVKGSVLYLGVNLSANCYALFTVDVTEEENLTSVYQKTTISEETRCFLYEGIFYIPQATGLIALEP